MGKAVGAFYQELLASGLTQALAEDMAKEYPQTMAQMIKLNNRKAQSNELASGNSSTTKAGFRLTARLPSFWWNQRKASKAFARPCLQLVAGCNGNH